MKQQRIRDLCRYCRLDQIIKLATINEVTCYFNREASTFSLHTRMAISKMENLENFKYTPGAIETWRKAHLIQQIKKPLDFSNGFTEVVDIHVNPLTSL